ncbi:MAG: 5-formyltetrahydrofolate cyclo-ligase [Clostridia bacterium]|nr:5-formyltetrahydrofolate cyclo-ligase [Clostridia bacterium]
MDKTSQRKALRAIIAGIFDKARQSEQVARLLQNVVLPSGSICIYNSLPSEVDTKQIIEYFCQRREVYLPVVDGEDMLLVKVDKDTQYQVANWGIYEPIGKRYLPSEIRPAVTVTPLLGVDEKLNRLGKGKGYYDRYFQSLDTFKVGLAFEEQVVDKVICDPWDKPLDMLITSKGIIKRRDL